MLLLATDTSGRQGSIALARAESAPSAECREVEILEVVVLWFHVDLTQGHIFTSEEPWTATARPSQSLAEASASPDSITLKDKPIQYPMMALGGPKGFLECPLRAMSRRCRQTDAHARSLSDSLISRNSRSARSASASSKGRSCRHCSDRRKSQAGRNSASRHRTRNNLGLDRYTKGAGCDAPCAKPNLSGRKLEGCYSAADDSPARIRSRASVAPAGYELG